MKKEEKIIWECVSFKEHLELNNHWTLQGIMPEDNNRRFLMFCNKDIKVLLQDVKTGEIFDVEFGALARGKNLALDIIEKEKRVMG